MDAKTIRTRLQELAFLNSKATIWYKASSAKQASSASSNGNGAAPAESAEGGWEKLHYSGGLREYVQHLNQDNSPMHEPIFIQGRGQQHILAPASFRSSPWSLLLSTAPCTQLSCAQLTALCACKVCAGAALCHRASGHANCPTVWT